MISATSDIAVEMCVRWQERGWNLCGTYFTKGKNYQLLKEKNIPLVACNMADELFIDRAAQEIKKLSPDWDFVVFATGSLAPVGPFEKVDIDQWSSAVQLNFVHQMRMLHRLLAFRGPKSVEKSVIFFAGGGANNAVTGYSSYALSKIALIKAVELLDAEIEDVKFTIIGPGWVKTKIHQATIEAGHELAGENFAKTKQKMESDECVPISSVIDSFEWALAAPKNIVSGRNFSTAFDSWGEEELSRLLAADVNMYKLRRAGNNALVKQKREKI